MYSHGLCAIALCEAYGMSGDEKLKEACQLSLNFIVSAQDPVGGGWRYGPRQAGDTSIGGWQLAALKSGRMAKLNVPEKTLASFSAFLDSVQTDSGAKYGYTTPGAGPATTSIGLLSRLHLGWRRDHDALKRGIENLQEIGPSKENLYFNYYATQVMYRYGGKPWQQWNEKLQDMLLASQADESHQAGSWYIGRDYGTERGGRLYCTSLVTLTLEIPARNLLIFQVDEE